RQIESAAVQIMRMGMSVDLWRVLGNIARARASRGPVHCRRKEWLTHQDEFQRLDDRLYTHALDDQPVDARLNGLSDEVVLHPICHQYYERIWISEFKLFYFGPERAKIDPYVDQEEIDIRVRLQ